MFSFQLSKIPRRETAFDAIKQPNEREKTRYMGRSRHPPLRPLRPQRSFPRAMRPVDGRMLGYSPSYEPFLLRAASLPSDPRLLFRPRIHSAAYPPPTGISSGRGSQEGAMKYGRLVPRDSWRNAGLRPPCSRRTLGANSPRREKEAKKGHSGKHRG